MFAGSKRFLVTAGTYTLKIELLEGTRTRLDYVAFEWVAMGCVEEPEPAYSSWGRVKNLFG